MDRTPETELENRGRFRARLGDYLGWILWIQRGGRWAACVSVLACAVACAGTVERTRYLDPPDVARQCPALYAMAANIPERALLDSRAVRKFSDLAGECVKYYHDLAWHNRQAAQEAEKEIRSGGFWTGFGSSTVIFLLGIVAGVSL